MHYASLLCLAARCATLSLGLLLIIRGDAYADPTPTTPPKSDKPAPEKTPTEKPVDKTTPLAAKGDANIGVALLDVGRIYEGHAWFKKKIADMKTDVQGAEAGLKADRDRLEALANDAKTLTGADLAAAEKEYATKQAAFNLKASLQKKKFLEDEAKIYQQVYQEIREDSASYCKARGIHVLMRYSSPAEKPDQNREEILQQINRPIIYSDVPDITEPLLEIINGRDHPDPSGEPDKT